jgi:hypothetical protein
MEDMRARKSVLSGVVGLLSCIVDDVSVTTGRTASELKRIRSDS